MPKCEHQRLQVLASNLCYLVSGFLLFANYNIYVAGSSPADLEVFTITLLRGEGGGVRLCP